MKRLLLVLLLLLGGNKIFAQDYDLSEYFELLRKGVDMPTSQNTRIEDRKGLLNPFQGYWVGSYKQYTYEFFIKKVVEELDFVGYKVDCLYADFNVYDNSRLIDLYNPILSSLKEYSHGGVTKIPTLEGYHLSPQGTYALYYEGEEGFAGLRLKVLDSTRMEMYIMADPNWHWVPNDTPFPYWDGWKRSGDATILYKRGNIDQKPPSLPTIKSGTFDRTILNMLLRYTYIACWENIEVKYVRPELINRLELSQDTYADPTGLHIIPREEGGTIKYRLDFSKDFAQFSRGKQLGIFYRSLYHVALYDAILQSLSQRSDKSAYREMLASREYRTDFAKMLKLYGKHKGLTAGELNKLFALDVLDCASPDVFGHVGEEASDLLEMYIPKPEGTYPSPPKTTPLPIRKQSSK